MNPLYDISTSQLSSDLLPIDERTTENKSLLQGLLSGFNYMWTNVRNYMDGADTFEGIGFWSAGTYSEGDKVIYMINGSVYECVVSSTTTTPSTSPDWKKVQDLFIGVNESQLFGGGKMQLEYALNRRFDTNYVDPHLGISDIYVTNVINPIQCFYVGGSSNSSWVYSNNSSQWVYNDYDWSNITIFTIFVPNATYTALGSDPEKPIRQFVDRFLPAGLTYSILDY